MAAAGRLSRLTSRSAKGRSWLSVDVDSRGAAQIVNAAGKIVAPGFIDVHTHDDSAC
jgi:cytosine/adenosine deaminase-related metal-dependent hydrolase